jgi:hypothetical protein
MANTLTNLIGDMYTGLSVVSRELIGFIPAASRDPQTERAAKGQTVRSPATRPMTAGDVTPGATGPATGNNTIDNIEITISKSRSVNFTWNGEEQKGLNNNNAPIVNKILADQFAQAFRTLTNEIETDCAALYKKASRAVGTAGTLPFGTAGDFSDFANIVKELNINGAPKTGRRLVLGNLSAGNLRAKQNSLFRVNEAGSDELLRTGMLGQVQGLGIGESNQIVGHTKGTGASYTTSTAGFAVGATEIALITGTGTVLAGDVITFAGDSNKYIVEEGITAPGTITIQKPGLRKAIAASAVNATVGASANEMNVAFNSSSLLLASRLPALPDGGDDADDTTIVVDPVSGLAFEVSIYRQYRQITFFVGIAWGVQMVNPEHSIVLLG